MVTKSGTNQIHGSLFEFVRNGYFNARNFFAPQADTLKRNQFGGSVGGAIIKNKLFYFGTYQGTRIRSTPFGTVTFVPTAAERQGDFSTFSKKLTDPLTGQPFPNNVIPVNRLSPAAQYLLNYVPLPNGPGRLPPRAAMSRTTSWIAPRTAFASGELPAGGGGTGS